MEFTEQTARHLQTTFNIPDSTVRRWRREGWITDRLVGVSPDDYPQLKHDTTPTFRIGDTPLSAKGQLIEKAVLDLLDDAPRWFHAKRLGSYLNYQTKLQVMMTKVVRGNARLHLHEEEADSLARQLATLEAKLALYLALANDPAFLTHEKTVAYLRDIFDTPYLNTSGIAMSLGEIDGKRLLSWLTYRKGKNAPSLSVMTGITARLNSLHRKLKGLPTSLTGGQTPRTSPHNKA